MSFDFNAENEHRASARCHEKEPLLISPKNQFYQRQLA